MSFVVLPPEVTSAQVYTGAGSAPMLAAAAAWDELSSELSSAAESFSSVISGLVGAAWQGAAATAMTTVAGQYSQWLGTAAAHTMGAAQGAQAIAGIFEAAKAAITHPMAVLANRMQLMQLVRSNVFGFAAPAIAATEGAYEEMWAQNVAALTGYHGAASAVAAQMNPLAQAVQALPAALRQRVRLTGNLVSQVMTNNSQSVIALQNTNATEFARTQALAGNDLALARREMTGIRSAPLAHLQRAGQYFADAGLVNVGTGLQLAGRTTGAAAVIAGQDFGIAGGTGPMKVIPPPTVTKVPYESLLTSAQTVNQFGGGLTGSVQQQLMEYNQNQLMTYNNLTNYQFSTTQHLAADYFSRAGAAVARGDLFAAANYVGGVAAADVGTGLQWGGRTMALAPMLLGGDISLAGGGSSLLQAPAPVRAPIATG